MAAISPIMNPVSQAVGSPLQGGRSSKPDASDTRTVKPLEETARSKADGPGNNDARSSFGRDKAVGVNGSTSESGNKGATSTGNAGLLSRGAKTSSSGARESSFEARAESGERSRARSSGKSYGGGGSVVENVVKANPDARIEDIVARPETDPSTQAKLNTARFVDTLDQVRKAEQPVANDNDRPVALNTNDSSEPVGRYDKSA